MNIKLSDDDIKNIRLEYMKGASIQSLSEKYNIHIQTMSRIINRKGRYKRIY